MGLVSNVKSFGSKISSGVKNLFKAKTYMNILAAAKSKASTVASVAKSTLSTVASAADSTLNSVNTVVASVGSHVYDFSNKVTEEVYEKSGSKYLVDKAKDLIDNTAIGSKIVNGLESAVYSAQGASDYFVHHGLTESLNESVKGAIQGVVTGGIPGLIAGGVAGAVGSALGSVTEYGVAKYGKYLVGHALNQSLQDLKNNLVLSGQKKSDNILIIE